MIVLLWRRGKTKRFRKGRENKDNTYFIYLSVYNKFEGFLSCCSFFSFYHSLSVFFLSLAVLVLFEEGVQANYYLVVCPHFHQET